MSFTASDFLEALIGETTPRDSIRGFDPEKVMKGRDLFDNKSPYSAVNVIRANPYSTPNETNLSSVAPDINFKPSDAYAIAVGGL